MSRTRHAVAVLVASLALAGCAGQGEEGATPTPPATSSWPSSMTPAGSSTSSSSSSSSGGTSPSSSSSSSSSSVPSGTASAAEEWDETGLDLAEVDRTSRRAVAAAQTLADRLEAHRSKSKAAWLAAIEPSLTSSGVQQMEQLSPNTVGFTARTGSARAIVTEADLGSRYVSVGVPTDQGPFLFLAQRSGSTWKIASVSRIGAGREGD